MRNKNIIFGSLLFIFSIFGFVVSKKFQGASKSFLQEKTVATLTSHKLGTKEFARELYRQGFEVLGVNFENNTVDVMFNGPVQVYSKDVEIVSTKNLKKMELDSRYVKYSSVKSEIEKIAAAHPELVSYFSIGKTLENQDIWALKISSKEKNNAEKTVVLFNGMHHAREVMTPEVVFDIARNLTENYSKSEEVKRWLSKVDVFLIPMVNPDGNKKVFSGQTMWRKNTRNGYGVDLNRNYPYKWSECNGSSGSTFSDQYRGEKAASEPETQAMVKFIEDIKPKYSISYHSYSEIVIYPYSCEGEHVPGTEGAKIEEMGKKLASLHERDSGNGTYEAGTSWELLYSVDGGDIDWMYSQVGTIPFVVELNSSLNGFQPDYSKVGPTLNKVRKGWQYILETASQE